MRKVHDTAGDLTGLPLPAPALERPDALVLENRVPVWTRTLAVRAWPGAVPALWEAVLSVPAVFRVRFTAAPSGFAWSAAQQTRLRRLMQSLEEQAARDRAAAVRPDEAAAVRAMRWIRDALLYRGLRAVDVWCLITVSSDSPKTLDEDCHRVVAALRGRGVEVVTLRYEQAPGFAVTLPVGDVLMRGLVGHRPKTGVASAAAAAVPADTGWASERAGLYIGHTVTDRRPVVVDFRREQEEFNTNCVVVGAAGEGKSTWMKAVAVTGALLDGWHVLVLDVNGEYRELCRHHGGEWIDLSGDAGRYPDPCRLPERTGRDEDDAYRFDRMVAGISHVFAVMLGTADEMERAVVEQETLQALSDAGVVRPDPSTWDNGRLEGNVTLQAIYRRIARRAAGGDPWAAPVAQKLWRYFEGSLAGMFERPIALPTMPGRLVVLHVGNPRSSPADAGTLSVKYQLALSTMWEWLRQNRAAGRWTAVVVDEGQRAMENPVLAANVADLATTMRHYRGALFLATNVPGRLWESGYGEALWGNSLFKVVFALEESQVQALAEHADMPEGVLDAVRRQLHTRMAVVRLGGAGWEQVRLVLPDEELELYRTRRLRKGEFALA